MNETAYILNTATERSLVIMDEVGRGTGTNDGLSIAWAVSEELLNRIKCRTFFATHYHELSLLQHPRVVNRSMEVLEKDGGIVFLRRLKEGPAAESYGLHVARLAGLSPSVLERARQIMGSREWGVGSGKREEGNEGINQGDERVNDSSIVNHANNQVNQKITDDAFPSPQSPVPSPHPILRELAALDPNAITPLEALALVGEWKKRLAHGGAPVFTRPAGAGTRPRSGKATGGKAADSAPSLFD
jgi:DNA mismatch repair protein MutS